MILARRSTKRNLSNIDRRLQKAKRLIEQNRVFLEFESEDVFAFRVLGDTEEHRVLYRGGKWMCDCEFNSIYPMHPCSHILACQMYLENEIRGGE